MSDNKKKKELRNQKLTLVLTKKEKLQIQEKAELDGRSQTQFIIKFLYDKGILKK